MPGVDLNETLLWHIRGGKTRLELDRPPKIVKMCPWSYAQLRDCEVEIVDAIADVRAEPRERDAVVILCQSHVSKKDLDECDQPDVLTRLAVTLHLGNRDD